MPRKKPTHPRGATVRPAVLDKGPRQRPVGMQAMGPALYAQLRRALMQLSVAST